MDPLQFDGLTRVIGRSTTIRRRVLVSGVLGMTLGIARLDAEAKKKKKKKKPVSPPPAPPLPPSPPPVPVSPPPPPPPPPACQTSQTTCTAAQGSGCCDADFPQCCPPNRLNKGGLCAPSGADCCTETEGGGFCAGTFNTCCPITPSWPYGGCTNQGGTCCPLALGGDICDAPFSTCCQDDFGSYCCGDDETCCVDGTDCGAGETCEFGCCIPDVAGLQVPRMRAARERRTGGRAKSMPASGTTRIS